ncbi:MAG: ASCH domain-containing protein [Pseudomonadota bacterium]
MPSHIAPFWQRYLATCADPDAANARFYESFRIGDGDAVADAGAALILGGEKTTTSSPLWEYQETGKPQPSVGALSVLEDGRRNPVCVVESVWVEVVRFADVDAAFARAYGETDGTLAGWRDLITGFYTEARCGPGRAVTDDTPLVCERFRIVFR